MSEAVGQILVFGVGVALSPSGLIATVLMLVRPGGRRSAGMFVAAWAASLTVAGTVALLLADGAGASDEGERAGWVVGVQLAVALMLVGLATSQWRGRRREGAASEMPQWMRKVDGLTPGRAVGMAVFLASGKPKNLLMTIGAAIAIAELGVAASAQAAALAIFVALGTLAPAVPFAIALTLGERSDAVLRGLREWMVRESATIVAVLCLVIAAKLIGDALGG